MQIVRIDPAGHNFKVLAETPNRLGCMTIARNGRLYCVREAELYCTPEPIQAGK